MNDPRKRTIAIALIGNILVFGVCVLCYCVSHVNLVPVMIVSVLLTTVTIIFAVLLGKKSGGDLKELEHIMSEISSEGHSEASAKELLRVYNSGWQGRNKLVVGAACADELDSAGLIKEASEVVSGILPLTDTYNKTAEDRAYCAMAWLVSFSCAAKRKDKETAARSFERYSEFVKETLGKRSVNEEYKSVCAEYEALCGEPEKAESIYLSKQELTFSDLVGLTRLYSSQGSREKAEQALRSAASIASNDAEHLAVKALEIEIKQ